VNPWPGVEAHGFTDFLRWTIERRKVRGPAEPARPEPWVSAPAFATPRADPDTLSATWIGHSSALVQVGGLNILTDPIWSDRASPLTFAGPKRLAPPGVAFDDLPIIDAVVISHNHYDHLDADTVARLISRFPAAAWRVPLGVGRFIRGRGAADVEECGWHDHAAVGSLRLVCVPAQHFSGRGLFDRNKTLWCGWVLLSGRHSVYFAGDTALHPEFGAIGERAGPFDLVMLPIGAYEPRWFMRSVHMNPEDTIEAYRALTASQHSLPACLALHWGTFRLTDEAVDEPPARFARLWEDAGFAAGMNWTFVHGETRKL
jgi:N-acyl-phosphatidylethanolamine-hydrolysing phospholipase D